MCTTARVFLFLRLYFVSTGHLHDAGAAARAVRRGPEGARRRQVRGGAGAGPREREGQVGFVCRAAVWGCVGQLFARGDIFS